MHTPTQFSAFLECTLTHKDYYAPFLEMMLGMEEDEDAAAAAAEATAGQEGGKS